MTERGAFDVHGATDAGLVRRENEDQFLIAHLGRSMHVQATSLTLDDGTRVDGGTQGSLLLVADGVGGGPGGAQASSTAVDTVVRYVLDAMPWRPEDGGGAALREALHRSQAAVQALSEARADDRMATTVTFAFVAWPEVHVVHAGDSRCYVLRGGGLRRATTDHTVAERLRSEAGRAVPPEAESVLWNAVGGPNDELDVEMQTARLRVGDALLLCTDGLTGQVAEPEIARILHRAETAAIACRDLIAAANAAGGADNVTAVVGYFRPPEQAAERAAAAAAEEPAALAGEAEPTAGDADAPEVGAP